MRKLLLVGLLMLSGCYSMRWARFVDESEDSAPAWLCVPDKDPTNPKGIMCADLRRFNITQAMPRTEQNTTDM